MKGKKKKENRNGKYRGKLLSWNKVKKTQFYAKIWWVDLVLLPDGHPASLSPTLQDKRK